MNTSALGEAVSRLPGLCPCASSLLTAARSPAAEAWPKVRFDPGFVLLILRHASPARVSPALSFFPTALGDPAVLRGALQLVQGCTGAHNSISQVIPWIDPRLEPIYHVAIQCARASRRLAEWTSRCDSENAWVAGLLAPLGWMALAASVPELVEDALIDPALLRDAGGTQRRLWGMDHAALLRRLGRLWNLPQWLISVVGHLGLPVAVAQEIGADPELFLVVRTAVRLVEKRTPLLQLLQGAESSDPQFLELSVHDQESLTQELGSSLPSEALPAWTLPSSLPLLPDLLAMAVENHRLRDAQTIEHLEHERDVLHEALEQQRRGEQDRLQSLKLSALAEFSAGAAHEINNPLAVISGQAQYLLGREDQPAHQKALQTIIGQTQRVHQVLTELMQFARPPRSQKQRVDATGLIRDVLLALKNLATERNVTLQSSESDNCLEINADPRQLRTALECLLRNAIEAAPSAGWARIRVEQTAPECVEFWIEDSGPGPAAAELDRIFDPFFSGRQAGRGRGLGLPTAWRLAQEQGGDVRYEPLSGGPTRFILTLPSHAAEEGLPRVYPGCSSNESVA